MRGKRLLSDRWPTLLGYLTEDFAAEGFKLHIAVAYFPHVIEFIDQPFLALLPPPILSQIWVVTVVRIKRRLMLDLPCQAHPMGSPRDKKNAKKPRKGDSKNHSLSRDEELVPVSMDVRVPGTPPSSGQASGSASAAANATATLSENVSDQNMFKLVQHLVALT